MECAHVTERLLVNDLGSDPELDQHVAECSRCSHMARGVARLDAVLGSSLVVAPPLELQQRLAALAVEMARPPRNSPWWTRLGQLNLANWLAQRPQMVAAQGFAAVLVALASWQVFGWLSAVNPVLGDVSYAMELVAASPAVAYIGGLQLDFQGLGLWSLVGIGGWLLSEDGLIGRRLASTRFHLP